MNHFLLPAAPGQGDAKMLRYGAHATLGPIGQANATFALNYLSDEDIPCIAKSLGGTQARRIIFRPATGHVRQLIVNGAVPEQKTVAAPVRKPAARDDVILF